MADTIAAISTASGQAGIGVVRVSGALAADIGKLLTGKQLKPGEFIYTPFHDASAETIDFGIALFFASPHSYTGEDIVEFQGHGGSAVLDLLLQAALAAGARLAKPGEFTERAFLNDKLDLAQAEAVIDLIESANTTAARAAVKSLGGVFSNQVNALVEQLIELRVYVEAALDFTDEEIDFLSGDELKSRADNLAASFASICKVAEQGQILKEGMTLVIAGRPNVGKSSLLNTLTGRESAIVTHIAGTTRDILREHIHIDGLPLHIVDTAGLQTTDDPVEQEGIRRAKREIEQADRVLLVLDDRDALEPIEGELNIAPTVELNIELNIECPPHMPVDLIYNKIDKTGKRSGITKTAGRTEIRLSAMTGEGVDTLRTHLKDSIGYQQNMEDVFIARSRHVSALNNASAACDKALHQLRIGASPELAAQDLRDAQQCLSEITGEFSSDDLLGRIFAGFCIGK